MEVIGRSWSHLFHACISSPSFYSLGSPCMARPLPLTLSPCMGIPHVGTPIVYCQDLLPPCLSLLTHISPLILVATLYHSWYKGQPSPTPSSPSTDNGQRCQSNTTTLYLYAYLIWARRYTFRYHPTPQTTCFPLCILGYQGPSSSQTRGDREIP